MEQNRITQLGDELYEAWSGKIMVAPLTEREASMTIDDAYAVQQRLLSRRQSSGARVIGKKVGVTSKAVMNMLEVYQPDFGYLLDDMLYNDGESIPRDGLIQPRAEGEIAFVLKHDLNGPGVSAADVLRATDFVMPCFEIVDSRIRDWKIRIQDTIADNASCGAFVLGNGAVDPRRIDLATCGMVLEKNGEIIATGAGAAALGNPLNAVAWLANTMGRLGVPLRAGEVVLSGALAAMFPAAAGDHFRVTIGGIGGCGVRFH
ncbi:2-oxopent-4-enoate hydratase [Massilia niastensis]|uniref:2-oxopent-4-enoate hydratase n=1 Tax=Massilia niastensis TaxID=544911 RepID=UPI0003617F81|nr:2-oxopent-4-enoate hydratase [Massilia niastensis]